MIASLLVSLVAVFGFALVLWKAEIGKVTQSLGHIATGGVSAMFDSALDDDEKEIAVRRAGLALLGKTWQLAWRFGLSLAAAAAPILLADAVGLAASEQTMALMLRVDYIVIVSLVAIGIAYLVNRRSRRGEARAQSGDDAYGAGDRFVHTLAFSTPGVMKTLAALDDRAFSAARGRVGQKPPVFVTSLARGGTTAILNAFHDMPMVATHEYRDMPFITAPYLWSKLGGSRSDRVARRERAHGDGLEIDLDSAEAFDEVLWRLFWPEKYGAAAIGLWQSDDLKPKAAERFLTHFAKIAALRRPDRMASGEVRYLSKNNANIARLRVLRDMFPGCEIVVPLRRPAAHAASLLRQHRNFLRQQTEDDFVRRYMSDIGHLEFGLLHRPIAFDGFAPGGLGPDDPDYWLHYWIAAFREVAAHGNGCRIVTQEDVRARPAETMTALCARLDLPTGSMDFTGYFRAGADAEPDELYSADLLATANAVYDELGAHAVR